MSIKVMYENNNIEEIETALLNKLACPVKIKKFLRSKDWVPIDAFRVRGITDEIYQGVERRGDKNQDNLYEELKSRIIKLEEDVFTKNNEIIELNFNIKKLTEEVKEEFEILRALINSIGDEIWYYDPKGNLLLINPQVLVNLGIEYGEKYDLQNMLKLFEILNKDGTIRSNENAPIYRALKGEIIKGEEILRNIKTKELRHRNFTTTPVVDSSGNIIGAVSIVRDITEQIKNEDKIKNLLIEKELILKEVHHRVKNNMMLVSSLLGLQAQYTDDKKVKEMFNESRDRIKAMQIVYDKLFNSENIMSVDLDRFLTDIVISLLNTYEVNKDKIDLKLEIENIKTEAGKAIHFGIIINELVTNSIKYAFPENKNGIIKINLFKDLYSNMFILIIADNGAGIASEFDINNTKSFGMILVSNLVKQMNGTIELKKENGTVFNMAFPL